MNISEHLQKDYWTRRVTPDSMKMYPSGGRLGYRSPKTGGFGVGYVNLTQDDFLNEIYPEAHEINSKFMSQRPIYKQTDEVDPKTGKKKWVLDGFDDVETVALAIQEMIVSKKVAHLTGDNFWVASEDKDEDAFEKVKSLMDYSGFWDAWVEAVSYCERTGDSALYWWYDGVGGMHYEVFSYEKGDTLYPGVDDDGNPTLYRSYSLNGKPAVDVFTVKNKETWVKVDTKEEAGRSFLDRLTRIVKRGVGFTETSEDGYQLLSRKDAQIGNDMLQVIYFRVPDIATGPVQDSIEKFERALSYVAEEVKTSAFPILFLKSEKITTLPPSRMNGKTIGVKGTADSLAHADARFIAPPDASNIAKINLDTLWNNILRGSLSALVEPVDIRQGADSSTTIKIMFAPDIQWCKNRWKFYAKPVRQLVEVFKRLVGKVEGDIQRYGDLRISCGPNVWIPANEAERVKIELDQYYAGVKSRKATMADIGNSHLGDAEQIMKEKEEEKALDAKYKTTTEVNDPNVPNITNQAKNQPRNK